MNNKQNRISLICQIIENETVRSQQDILEKLAEQGVEITQASLSRYLKEIQASRIPDGRGSYVYKMPPTSARTVSMISNEVISVEFVGPNMVVFRTDGGYADAVTVQIDERKLDLIAGTVSGDDTILVIIRDGYTRSETRSILIKEFPYIKDKILNE
ncbi:MAG: ArgR family transcriptional regulator [Bacteroidales bacterium]|jgi:transcriptional regulator of arginine metabolism|nr:ArgR family transcriptional regulator [Bacteroidales bacterium]